MRRFEWVQDNVAKYWEIEHFDDLVITRQGKIGKDPREVEKECLDDMEAEVEFDKMIHTKRRQGWVEVDKPSDPPAPIEARAMELRPLDGSAPQVFSGRAMEYIIWRLVGTQVLDRHRPADDLSRWHGRAARQLNLDAVPNPGDAAYLDWHARFIELSARDRAATMKNDRIAAFKWREGSHWIVTPAECVVLARESASRKLKRKKETADHKQWIQSWADFHEGVKACGYEAVPVE